MDSIPRPLSARLESIYRHCLAREPFWDLCCDHGQLGLFALHSGNFSTVIFNDAVARLLESLPERFGPHASRARMIAGPAEDIAETLTGSVVLAGVGGKKIVHILQSLAARGNLRAERLVVCPEKDAEWMMAQPIPGYTLTRRQTIAHNQAHRWIAVYAPETHLNLPKLCHTNKPETP